MTMKSAPVMLSLAALLWAGWCYLVVIVMVPAILRKLTIYPGTTAWVLCVAPLTLAAILLIMRLNKDES